MSLGVPGNRFDLHLTRCISPHRSPPPPMTGPHGRGSSERLFKDFRLGCPGGATGTSIAQAMGKRMAPHPARNVVPPAHGPAVTPAAAGSREAVVVVGLDELDADPALADRLPVVTLAERARQAARLAADLQIVLLARTANGHAAETQPDRLRTIPEVAEVLQFTEQYVYELIRRGHLPAVRSGKYVRVSASAVEAFMKNGPAAGLDGVLYQRYSPRSGRLRVAAPQEKRRIDAGGAGRETRRRAEQRRALGAQRASDRGADGATHPDHAGADEVEA